jgi:hypothetical protein
MSRITAALQVVILLAALVLGGVMAGRPPQPQRDRVLAAFATGLNGRTAAQRHNAMLAARALDGAMVLPGKTFSFNQCVRNWTADAGYRKAPVSNEGVLVTAVGGGVCQVSSTLYNAVLLADLPVLERHRHAVAPSYVPPGRDAAVAYDTLDLRFRNTYSRPVRIRAEVDASSLTVRLTGGDPHRTCIAIETRVIAREPSRRVLIREPLAGSARLSRRGQTRGHPGWRVVTYLVRSWQGQVLERRRISDDTYQAVHQVWFVRDNSETAMH